MKLSVAQIAQLASEAGFVGDDLVTAVAVAIAESGGDTMAYNPETAATSIPRTPGDGSYGLWQIFKATNPFAADWDLYDPQQNAAAAFKDWQFAHGFRPWSTYQNNLHVPYMASVRDAIAAGALSSKYSGSSGSSLVTLALVAAFGAAAFFGARHYMRMS